MSEKNDEKELTCPANRLAPTFLAQGESKGKRREEDTHPNNRPNPRGIRQRERLDTRPMQDNKTGPEQEHVEKPDQPEEQLHVDAGFVADLFFQHDRVHAVQDRAEAGHCVAERDLAGCFGRKRAACVAWVGA